MIEDIDDSNASANAGEERELDALIARYGGEYNRPPDIVPVEEIWSRIESGRKPVARSGWQQGRWRLIAASIAILGAGVVLGRGWEARAGHATGVAPSTPTVASATSVQSAPAAVTPVASGNGAPVAQPVETGANRVASAGSDAGQARIVRSVRALPRPSGAVPSELRQGTAATYQLATLRHFTEVETLLTSYTTSSHDAAADAQLASWARDLLSQTRMLLDSPAASDPARRKLLQDLEVVLVEMSQLSGDTAPAERDMIDGSVRGNDVITRLRSAVPAGGAMHLKELD